MMLKGHCGSIATSRGGAPASPSQPSSASMRTRGASVANSGTEASVKNRRAPLSRTMPASCSFVAPVGSGATAKPARTAPRNSST